MVHSKPLDLNVVDPPVWRIIVGEKIYGPFTVGQLRVFIFDGRINARSKVAEGDGGRIITAGEHPQLASAFAERLERARPNKLSNFVVITQSEFGQEKFVDLLNELGSFGEALPGVYLLSSNIRLAKIQSQFSEIVHRDEKVMIVDATNNRLGWLGLGLDTNDHMRTLWDQAA